MFIQKTSVSGRFFMFLTKNSSIAFLLKLYRRCVTSGLSQDSTFDSFTKRGFLTYEEMPNLLFLLHLEDPEIFDSFLKIGALCVFQSFMDLPS